jgi:hypothetical protein
MAFPPNSRGFFMDWKSEKGSTMQADDEKILRLSKEIIVKFIELGRVSPGNFDENFKRVFWTLKKTVVDAQFPSELSLEIQEKESPEDV